MGSLYAFCKRGGTAGIMGHVIHNIAQHLADAKVIIDDQYVCHNLISDEGAELGVLVTWVVSLFISYLKRRTFDN